MSELSPDELSLLQVFEDVLDVVRFVVVRGQEVPNCLL